MSEDLGRPWLTQVAGADGVRVFAADGGALLAGRRRRRRSRGGPESVLVVRRGGVGVYRQSADDIFGLPHDAADPVALPKWEAAPSRAPPVLSTDDDTPGSPSSDDRVGAGEEGGSPASQPASPLVSPPASPPASLLASPMASLP